MAILTGMQSGREQLHAWIGRRFQNVRGKQREAARLLGVDQSYLSQILSGVRRPGLDTAIRFERATGIPVEAWAPQTDGGRAASVPVAADNS